MKSYSLVDLIIYTVASYGLCFILMHGEILTPIREKLVKIKFFHQLLSCALCTGFWVGLLLSLGMPIMALYSSASCYLLYLVTEILINYAYADKSSTDQ